MLLIFITELLNVSREEIELLIMFHNYSHAKNIFWLSEWYKKQTSKNIYSPTYLPAIYSPIFSKVSFQ